MCAELLRIKEFQLKIEQQKLEAINMSTHIWTDVQNQAKIMQIAGDYNVLLHKDVLKVHTVSASKVPGSYLKDFASCIPKTIICAFVNTNYALPKKWINEVYCKSCSSFPNAKLYWVNLREAVEKDEREFLDKLNIVSNPTVVVYRLGHLVDLLTPCFDDMLEEGSQINPGPKHGKSFEVGKQFFDHGLKDYEERQRLKSIEEAEQERIEEMKYRRKIRERFSKKDK